jgi:type VI secretion system secreted protein VgrG
VLFHDARRLPRSSAGTIRFQRASATEQRDTITGWCGVRSLQPGRSSHYSWDYDNPRGASFMTVSATSQADQGGKGSQLAAGLERYLTEAPHVRDSYQDLRALAWQSAARSDFEAKCYYAECNVRDCNAGEYFSLAGHPDIDTHPEQEREFIILSQNITAQNNLPKAYDARVQRLFSRSLWHPGAESHGAASRHWVDAGGLRVMVRLTCVRRDISFAPAYDPRTDQPHPPLQSAVVTGPEGEEVLCDALGRVRVRFGGMRSQEHGHAQGAGASGTDADSAWVRVATNWAGADSGNGAPFGALSLPRAGTEVLIDFLGAIRTSRSSSASCTTAPTIPPALATMACRITATCPASRAGKYTAGAPTNCGWTTRRARSALNWPATMDTANSIWAGCANPAATAPGNNGEQAPSCAPMNIWRCAPAKACCCRPGNDCKAAVNSWTDRNTWR